MTQKNYHIIGADGYLYKCINAVDDPEYAVTHLSEYGEDKYERKIKKFLNYEVPNDNCKSCQFYPICYGGCEYMNRLNGFQCNKKMFNEIETQIIKEIVNVKSKQCI